jgi:flagella basal body P-ring formation protein FlgA
MRLALVVLAALLGAAAASEGVVVTLRPTARVAAERALLADVATIVADQPTVELLGGVTVQELPDLGERTIDAAQVRSLIARLVPGRPLAVSGACALNRAALVVTPERFAVVAEAAVRAKAGSEARVVVARRAAEVVVPDDAASPIEIVADPLIDDPLGEVPVRLRVLRAGREIGRGLAVLHVAVLRDQVVAARALRAGTVVGLDDLRVEAREARPGDAANPATVEAVLGWVVRADVSPGTPLTRRVAMPQPAVRGGRAVELLYLQGQLAIAAPGIALGDGAIGDLIQVRRASDNRAVAAKVVADGRAQVNF